jgi:small subunit ribosomal protein S6
MENKYELVLVINSDKYQDVLESVGKLFSLNKAKINSKEEWGLKQLAYTIEGQTNANYVIFNISLSPTVSGKLQQQLNIEEGVIRYLMVTLEDDKAEVVSEK